MAVLNRITDLGIIQYTNEAGDQNQGFLYVDTNQVMQFQTNIYGPSPLDEQTCTIITGSLPPVSGSSSVSALLEIQSSTGGLLISRLTQDEVEALVQVVNGFIVYNTTAQQFEFYQNGAWVGLPSGGSIGTVVGPSASTVGDIAVFDNTTGTLIADSGTNLQNGNLNLSGALTVAGATILNGSISSTANLLSISSSIVIDAINPQYQAQVSGSYMDDGAMGNGDLNDGSTYSINTQNYILASSFFAYSSINIKNILAEGEEIEKEAINLFKQIPFKKYEFKDKLTHGDKVVYGMIAEELEKVLPVAVADRQEFVPNIMTTAIVKEVTEGMIQLSFDNSLENFFNKDFVAKEIRMYIDNRMLELKVDSINQTFVVVKTIEKLFSGDRVFVYGTKENCPTVAKNDIFEMGMLVLQNALKRIEQLENKVGA